MTPRLWIALAFSMTVWAGQPEREAVAAVERSAAEAMKAKRFAQARDLYFMLAEKDERNREYVLWIARLSAWMKDYDRAHVEYDRVLAFEPRNLDALLGKAYVHIWQRQYEQAERLLLVVQEMEPRSIDAAVALARVERDRGRKGSFLERAERAIALAPDSDEARRLHAQALALPPPLEVRVGYGQDRFSFTEPGHTGFASIGWVGETNRATLHFEGLSRFGEQVQRVGASFTQRFSERWWVSGSGLASTRYTIVFPRQEYTAGLARRLPRGIALGWQYRGLRFVPADVHVLSQSFEYDFPKAVWLEMNYYRSWTLLRNGAARAANNSYLFRYHQRIGPDVVLRAGYARGNETFAGLTVDRLGKFQADTVLSGLDWRLSREYSIGAYYSWQVRSTGTRQNTFGLSFTARK